MAPIVSDDGNIQAHGREGIYIILAFEDAEGDPRDMSEATVRFETPAFSKALAHGDQPHLMVLELDRDELPDTVGKVSEFAVIEETTELPHVIWSGKLILTGWRA